MKKLLLLLLCVPLLFSCGDNNNLQTNITLEMFNEGYTGKGNLTFPSSSMKYVGEWKDSKFYGLCIDLIT